MAAGEPGSERLAQALISQAHLRLELLGLELAAEEVRLGRLLFWELMAAFFLCAAIALGLLLALALAWDGGSREAAISLAAALCLAAAAGCWGMLQAAYRRKPAPFHDSVAELRKDAQSLARMH